MIMIQIEWFQIVRKNGAAFTRKILRTYEGTFKANERAVYIGTYELWSGNTMELLANFLNNIRLFLDDKFPT
jgi:hypothetical protein